MDNDEYMMYREKHVRPYVRDNQYNESVAWLINIGVHAMRGQRWDEAGYCFEGARVGSVKYLIEPTQFQSCLNGAFTVLRSQIIPQGSKFPTQYGTEIRLVPFRRGGETVLGSDGEKVGKLVRPEQMLANSLLLAFAFATVVGLPPGEPITRSEVNPFGSDTSFANEDYVLRVAERLMARADEMKGRLSPTFMPVIDRNLFIVEDTV